MMQPTILLAHAYLPAALRARYEAACPGWRIVPFVSTFPGMSSAYTALAADLRRRYPGPLLAALLRHLKVADAGPVVVAWYSGGYAMARELAADGAKPAAWVGIDGMHTGKDGDGTASDAGVEWLVKLARAALVGETVVALGHSDVRTYGTVASTTDVAREVRRLADVPPGDKHGGLILRAYNVRGPDHDEHVAALSEWGPTLLGEAVALASGVAAPPLPPPPVVAPATSAWADPAPGEPLRRGHRGPRVKELQLSLAAAGYPCDADGLFGPATEAQVKALQRRVGLPVTGVVGEGDLVALRAAVASASADPYEDTLPEIPGVLSDAEVDALFGPLLWVHAPRADEPGAVRITNGWTAANLRRVVIPQLRGVEGAPPDGGVYLHRLVAEQTRALFAAWEAAGLIRLVRTWAGSWNPRLVRGGSTLSRHSYATSFDINAAWNPMGRPPAPQGAMGSVVELVPLAVEHGFTWGGQWSRPDGMHFEGIKAL